MSSCGYHTALSRSTSNNSSITEKVADNCSEDNNEQIIERTLTDSEEKPDIALCDNNNVKMLDNHIVVVTPPQDESLKWAGSLQESITSHLSTILLSADHEQVYTIIII